MTNKIIVYSLIVLALVTVIFLERYQVKVAKGEPAPGFSLPIKGGTASLDQYRGKVLLINFWATWCPPCVSEMPSLAALRKEMEGQAFEILAISEDEEGWGAIDLFTRRLPLPFPVLLDPGGGVATEYGVGSLPESFLIDKNGIVVKHYRGPREWTDAKIREEIERYVNDK